MTPYDRGLLAVATTDHDYRADAWSGITAATGLAWLYNEDDGASAPVVEYSAEDGAAFVRGTVAALAAPDWFLSAIRAGAEATESGEHGFYSVLRRSEYVTDCDCAPGTLAIGDVTGPADDPTYSEPDTVTEAAALASIGAA